MFVERIQNVPNSIIGIKSYLYQIRGEPKKPKLNLKLSVAEPNQTNNSGLESISNEPKVIFE